MADEEIKAEYDKFCSGQTGKEYKARHILVEKKTRPRPSSPASRRGAKFEDIAKKESKDPWLPAPRVVTWTGLTPTVM